MSPETLREFCLSLKAVTESFPFDDDALVFKVMGKMFALTSLEDRTLSLKCDPEKAIVLREQYPSVTPGYHMSKKHWNTIQLNGSIPDTLIREWIVDSYGLVVAGLTKKQRDSLKG
ncbi:MAG: MmcQ/YjbR family DNA-binding protein [Bacteroidales bacterium]|nr:MmcQ/YjbR family DNA-binding protein [Bacteroidales bacterium]